MTDGRRDQVQRLFEAALDREPAERAAFLDGLGATDPELRNEVEILLAYHEDPSRLERDPSRAENLSLEKSTRLRPSSERTETPSRIGAYRILQKIGEGGMGIVYEAEQEKPVRRKVALKLIKWGMDTKAVIGRFESERQALALMNHPNIASVYDAGATEEGRPYFAMELVHGEPITTYCDKQRLTVKERLALFIQVCEGVQHAHQKSIIHRDIKPSNILVSILDDRAVPKIIDFGVAKATSQKLTERTVYTELGQWVGTPEYMSPEQAEMTGLDIDTRTDVYSLGVVLYELLSGAQPFDATELRRAGFDGIRRILREEEPPKPSTKVHSLGRTSTDSAKNRRVELPALERELCGDLDWITMKALEKDRTRRYGSPAELATDISRHLKHEPVLASPPSTLYRAGKFVRRHRTGVATAAVLLALLVSFAATMTVQSVRIARERNRAEHEAAKSRAINEFLLNVLGTANPRTGRGTSATIVEALDSASGEIDRFFPNDPEIRAAVQNSIGLTYMEIGRYDDAESLLQAALRLRREVLGDKHPGVVESLNSLAELALSRGDRVGAETLLREAVLIGRSLPPREQLHLANSLDSLGFLVMRNGGYDDARSLHEEALSIFRKLQGEESREVHMVLHNLGVLAEYRGDFETAESLYKSSLRYDKHEGLTNLDTAVNVSNLGWLCYEQGRFSTAEQHFRRALAIVDKIIDTPNPGSAGVLSDLAMTLVSLEEYEEATRLFEAALEIHPDLLAVESQRSAQRTSAHSKLLATMERYEEAEADLLPCLDLLKRELPPNDPRTRRTLTFLVELYDAWGKPEKAAGYRAMLDAKDSQ